jgi:colanic acid biosynthesis glycosyl transferase WcaI
VKVGTAHCMIVQQYSPVMKILIYSVNFAPEPTGVGKYSGEMAEWLADHGHEVRVIAAPPYYPAWSIDPQYKWPPYRHERWKGVKVWRAPIWVPRNPGGSKRVLHLLSFATSSIPLMLRQLFWRPDVVLTLAPALACAPMGWLTARLCGAKAWLHVQDFEVDVAFSMGLLKGRIPKSLVLGMERTLLRRFDMVSTISRNMIKVLGAKGVLPHKTGFFPNWADVNKVKPLTSESPYRAELNIESNALVLLFSGTWGNKQGLMVIPEAAKLLAHRRDIVFVISGDGVMRPEIEAACATLPNVRLMPLQPTERLGDLLGLANIHLLPQSPEAEDLVLPSKLTGMLSSGRPIVATCRDGTEIASVVKQCGRVTPPEDAKALADAIIELANRPDECAVLGRKARQFAEENLAMDAILSRVMSSISNSAKFEPSSTDSRA